MSDSAHAAMRAAIVECRIVPGSVVSEIELSRRFAFGLASVRAALARLAAAGWIAPDGRRGSVVLPVSPEHLADLVASRRCLEPALLHAAPPAHIRDVLVLRATVFRAATHHDTLGDRPALLHQERDLLGLLAQAVAAPRIRGWLVDTWDLCLRADRHLERDFGIMRAPLPLADLAEAVAAHRCDDAAAILETLRTAFDTRASAALSRSAAPLAAPAPSPKPATGGSPNPAPARRNTAARRSQQSPRPRSREGDPA